MRRSLVGGALLASAFSPLLVIVVLIARPGDNRWVTAVLVVVCVAPVGALHLVLRALTRVQLTRLQTTSTRPRDQDVLGFLSAYVLPLAATILAGGGGSGGIATGLLLAFLALIYVRTGLYHLNPTLALLGYRLYEVVQENGAAVMLLTRAHYLPQQGDLDARRLADRVLIQIGAS